MEYISGFLEFISKGRRTAFIVGAAAWLFLALPQDVTSIINIPDFRGGVWLIAYIASAIFFFGMLYDFAVWSFSRGKEKLEKRRSLAQEKKELLRKKAELHDLPREAKKTLQLFIENKTNCLPLDRDAITVLLEEKDILYPLPVVSVSPRSKQQRTYCISDWEYRYLMKNPQFFA